MSKYMFSQCRLRKDGAEMVSWIEKKDKVKVGNFVEVFINDDKELWEILSIGSVLRDKSEINERSQDYKNMSKMTDSFVKHTGLFAKYGS